MDCPNFEEIKVVNKKPTQKDVDTFWFFCVTILTLWSIFTVGIFNLDFDSGSKNFIDLDFIDIPSTCKLDGLLPQDDFIKLRNRYLYLQQEFPFESNPNHLSLKFELNTATKSFSEQKELRKTCYSKTPDEVESMEGRKKLEKAEQVIVKLKTRIDNLKHQSAQDQKQIKEMHIKLAEYEQKAAQQQKEINQMYEKLAEYEKNAEIFFPKKLYNKIVKSVKKLWKK